MAKILVLYQSNAGRTKQMAELVAQGAGQIKHTEVRLKSTDEATAADIIWCDGLASGTPTNLGSISWKMKKFWDDMSRELWGKIDGKIACTFSSSASYGGGNEIACLHMLTILINYGFLVFGVTDFVGEKFSPHYGAISAGSPEGDQEQKACLMVGQRLAEWCSYFVEQRKDEHPMHKKFGLKTN